MPLFTYLYNLKSNGHLLSGLYAALCLACGWCYCLTESWLILGLPIVLLVFLSLATDIKYAFYLLLFSLPISIEYMVTCSLGTDLPSEPLMIFCTVLFLFYIAYRPHLLPPKLINHTIVGLLLLQLGWLFFSVFFSVDGVRSFKYGLAKIWYLVPFLFLFVTIYTPKRFNTMLWLLIVPTVLLVIKSLVTHASMDFAFEKINDTLRPFFRNHVNYAVLIALLLPWTYYLHQQQKPQTVRRYTLFLSLLLLIAGLYFSYTRAAILSMIVAVAYFYIIKNKWLTQALITVALLLGSIILFLKNDNRYLRLAPEFTKTVYHNDLASHLESMFVLEDVSSAERVYRWLAGLNMIPVHPLVGWGPNTFALHYKKYAVTIYTTWVSDNDDNSTVHNYPLLVCIEQGFIGLVLFLLLFLYLLYKCQTLYHRILQPNDRLLLATTSMVIVITFFNNLLADLIDVDKNGALFLIACGVIIILDNKYPTSAHQNIN